MTEFIEDIAALDLSRLIRAGDHLVWGQACGEPVSLIEALLSQASAIGPVSAFTATSFSGLLAPDVMGSLSLSSMGAIGALRTLAAAGKLSIVPCHVSQIGSMIDNGIIGCDVAMVQVSPPNEKGLHSFGLISDTVEHAIAKARIVIAEINDRVPFTHGASLPANRIDVAVAVSREPISVPAAAMTETDQKIAEHAARYIEDGAVLQVGIGGVPDAILRLLTDRRDLGVHSGMIGDSVADLMEAGVITNARKPIDPGISVTGALIGTRRLFDFADRNPAIAMRPATYTHDGVVLAQLEKFVTINAAIEVDLTGQANAEQSADRYLGGTGGQVDYVRAGARSVGGRSIIALPATARKGTISRITAALSGPVTTARSDVDVIITEYGAAELKGVSMAERTRRMVAIAHPDYREDLDRAAHMIRQRGY